MGLFLAFSAWQGTCSAMSKDDDGGSHLSFEGIALTGHPSAFMKALEQKGFKAASANDSMLILNDTTATKAALTGKIEDVDATLLCAASPKTLTVYGLNVVVNKRYKYFIEAKKDYDTLKDMLKAKYGPLKSIENIPAYKDRDAELKEPGNYWLSSRDTDEGKIYLQIKYSAKTEDIYVSMIFMDKTNSELSSLE
jgi:hypothetical protein